MMVRGHLLASIVLPKAIYGAAASPPNKRHLATLRAKVARALWGQANRWGANEVIFTVHTKGHILIPVQAWAYACINTTRRV